MTLGKALHDFFSGFGMSAYPNTSVPDDVSLPYLTYELSTNYLESGEVAIVVNIYMRTTSEALINQKAQAIGTAVGRGGRCLTYDNGIVWVKRGSPFSQALNDETDSSVKRRYINLTLEYFS